MTNEVGGLVWPVYAGSVSVCMSVLPACACCPSVCMCFCVKIVVISGLIHVSRKSVKFSRISRICRVRPLCDDGEQLRDRGEQQVGPFPRQGGQGGRAGLGEEGVHLEDASGHVRAKLYYLLVFLWSNSCAEHFLSVLYILWSV